MSKEKEKEKDNSHDSVLKDVIVRIVRHPKMVADLAGFLVSKTKKP